MLEYGSFVHGRYRAGIGDWKEKIRVGRGPAAGAPPPSPDEIRRRAGALRRWGYAPAALLQGADSAPRQR